MDLQGLLLLPQCRVQNRTHYMICIPCNKFKNKSGTFKIPKCTIANGFAISNIPDYMHHIVTKRLDWYTFMHVLQVNFFG
jgi:hypothetical protein